MLRNSAYMTSAAAAPVRRAGEVPALNVKRLLDACCCLFRARLKFILWLCCALLREKRLTRRSDRVTCLTFLTALILNL